MSDRTAHEKSSGTLVLENMRQAIEVIRTHKLRSFLLILGVAIGISAILAVVTILLGLGRQIERDMTAADRPYIMVSRFDMLKEGSGNENVYRRKQLDSPAAEAVLEYCDDIVYADFRVEPRGQLRVLSRGSEHTQPVKIVGTTTAFPFIHEFPIENGRYFSAMEVSHRRLVIVLAYGPAMDLFPHEDPIGKKVRIGPFLYEVVGTFAERKHIMGQLGEGYAMVPYTAYNRDFRHVNDEAHLVLSPAPGADMDECVEQVVQTMRAYRKVPPGDENDFSVITSEAFAEMIGKITHAIALILVAISSIGLLVGGIGVMNIMLISVTERTHEVGLRMSVGARRRDILFQFLIESATLTGIGGLLGVAGGLLGSQAISKATGFPLGISVFWIVVSVLFSGVIGLIFGIYPANRAAGMDPIEALQHEK